VEAVGIWHWWYARAGELLQSFARWEVPVVGKKELCSPSLKRRRGKVYMRKRNLYVFLFCFLQASRAKHRSAIISVTVISATRES